jgi:hypothetical protein
MMLTKEKNTPAAVTVEVTARQINEVANKIKPDFALLSQTYADLACVVATNGRGVTTINAVSPLAVEIRHLS